MEEKITLCGDNCIECPRYNAHSAEELKTVAELWYRVGWRVCVVPNEMIEEKTATIVGLDGRKMSKSYGNQVPLFADESVLKKLISGIKTDSSLPTEPKSTDCTLFEYIKLFGTEEKQAHQILSIGRLR